MEFIIRFFLGGIIVSIFAVIGDVFRPRTFSGLFGAAPTIALSSLGLAFAMDGAQKVATEARSMILACGAMFVYALISRYFILKHDWSSLPAALVSYVGWFGVAFGLWFVILR